MTKLLFINKGILVTLLFLFGSISLGNDSVPTLKDGSKINPEYPENARINGIEGDVVFKLFINKKGQVKKIEMVSGNPIFYDSSIEAIKKARWNPATQYGKPVGVWVQLPLSYKLENSGIFSFNSVNNFLLKFGAISMIVLWIVWGLTPPV